MEWRTSEGEESRIYTGANKVADGSAIEMENSGRKYVREREVGKREVLLQRLCLRPL